MDDATFSREAAARERAAATVARADAVREETRNRSIPDALYGRLRLPHHRNRSAPRCSGPRRLSQVLV